MNILVADDDRIVLESCRRILEAEGHTVFLTTNAVEALEAMEECNAHLLLVDVIMPEYNGMYLIGKVRKSRPDLPILVMSGYPTPETISSGISAGGTHFLSKPFTPDELLTSVRKALGKGQQR